MPTDTPSAVRHAKFTYIDYNHQVRASLNQDPVERKQIFLLFIALLAAQLQEPGCHAEAMRRPDAHLWKQAEEKELSALFRMDTFSEKIFIDDMTPAQRRLLLSTRWVYRYKTVDDQVTCKARLVARGDMQKDIPDDPYSPTCRFETLRVFCSIAAQFSLKISDYDVQNAYLQPDCRDEMYVRPAPGQAQEVDGRKFAYRLNKSFYGAKRSGKFGMRSYTAHSSPWA